MTAEHWAAVRALVEEAIVLPTNERLEYVRAQGADAHIVREAEDLLGFGGDASEVFAIEGWRRSTEPRVDTVEPEGSMIGHYRVLNLLGRGGMGAVYLAERADGEYQQQVAVKILQDGLFTAALVQRFRTERQILARLTHPGIARLLDGGITEGQKPYLVLEYVPGLPIDEFCAAKKLDVASKLRLFLKVAEAVQSAHQQLVLHLDLKPANILVTDERDPRLLDFGIARLLQEGNGVEGQVEQTLRMLTPRYASPEQATGAPLGVASDVFSLGTLLYKLLTGRLPYPIDNAAPLEAARMICNVPAETPSVAAAAKPEVAKILHGDLDTILLQALRKEPERRYHTVSAFSEDVERYLERRPVLAHADSLQYRVGKFLRRNAVSATITTAAVVLLSVAAVSVVRSDITARRERATAERRLNDVRGLAHSYIFDLIPELEGVPGTLKVRGEVVQRALGYLEAMSRERSTDPDMLRELASGYYTMGKLQGGFFNVSLGDRKSAWDLLNRGLALQRQLVAEHPNDLTDRAHLLTLIREVGNMRVAQGDLREGNELHEEAWKVESPSSLKGRMRRISIRAQQRLVCQHDGVWNGDVEPRRPDAGADVVKAHRRGLRRYATAHPEATTTVSFITQWTMSRCGEGDALTLLGRNDEALAIYPELLIMVDRQSSVETDLRASGTQRMVHERYARMLLASGKLAEATELSVILRPEKRNDRREAGKNLWDAFNLATAIQWAAMLDWHNGKRSEALREMNLCLKGFRDLHQSEPDLAWPQIDLVEALPEFAELPGMSRERAIRMWRESGTLATEYVERHPEALSARLALARVHLGLRDQSERAGDAEAALHEAVAARSELDIVLRERPGLPVAEAMLARTNGMPVDGSRFGWMR